MLELPDDQVIIKKDDVYYVWNQAHTVNMYNTDGYNFSVFTFGFNSKGKNPTLKAAIKIIEEYHEDYLLEE